jgi:TnpA family transposase
MRKIDPNQSKRHRQRTGQQHGWIKSKPTSSAQMSTKAHHAFDILSINTTDIQPEIHSTNAHGANEVNFALLHLFGYQFAPRYKDLFDKVCTCLCGFKHPSQYGNAILVPVQKAQKELIINEWDNVQRIIVSRALKATTRSTIVSKLSAYARNNRTKRALWEYDNIIHSLYLA